MLTKKVSYHIIYLVRSHSSAGRAPALQAGGHRFEPYCDHHFMRKWLSGRASPCQGEGREFESRLSLHYAEVAKLADAQDLKSCDPYTIVPVRLRSSAPLRLKQL